MLFIFLTLIFTRPFISSPAFPYVNMVYSYVLMLFLGLYIMYYGIDRIRIGPLKFALILFSLALVVSIFFSQNRLESIKELYKYITGILLLIVCASVSRETKLKIINIVIFASCVISSLAIYQYFFGFQHLLEYVRINNINSSFVLDYIQQKRVFFPFVTPGILGGYLIMMLMLVLTDKKYTKFIFLILIALLLTKSLGALLSLFLGLIVYFCLQNTPKKNKPIFILGLSVLALVLVFILRQQNTKMHTQPVFSLFTRMSYWQGAWSIIKAHPIAGVGLGNFNFATSRYAHNSYLQIWAEAGVLGIIGFLVMIFTIIRIGLLNIKQAKDSAILRGLILALIVLLFHNLLDFSFYLPEVSFLWWIMAGLVISV